MNSRIISKFKSLLYLRFFFKINMLTINNFIKLEIIVITQGNAEEKHIIYVT